MEIPRPPLPALMGGKKIQKTRNDKREMFKQKAGIICVVWRELGRVKLGVADPPSLLGRFL